MKVDLPDAEQTEAYNRSGIPRDGYVKIVLRRPKGRDKGYICAQSSYDPIVPETHRRGNDLADGAWTEETIDKIAEDLKRIVRGERS